MRKEPVKVIYITDLHEAVKEIRYLFRMTEADLYLVSGDLLYRAFYSYDLIYEFISLQEDFHSLSHLVAGGDKKPFDLAQRMIYGNLFNGSDLDLWLSRSERYLELYAKAKTTMLEKYHVLEEVFRKYCRVPVYVIPGNYDTDLNRTALQYRNLHKKSIYFYDYKISGFGGADVVTLGIPEKITIPYIDEDPAKTTASLAYEFFQREQPNIMLIHKPVYGFFDKLKSRGHTGSLALARLTEESSRLCLSLSGHIHDDRGVTRKNNTIYLNPGNFGRTVQIEGLSDGGFFAEIYLDRNPEATGFQESVRRVKLMALQKGRIQQLDEVIYYPDSLFTGKFGVFSELKTYFMQFETLSSKRRMRHFMRIARSIQGSGETIAFDILGSVNFGMSEEASDLDLVMYHSCPSQHQCDMAHCFKSKHYQHILENNLLRQFSSEQYPLEFIDCVNLDQVKRALANHDAHDETLIRYIFYRKLGRPINKRILAAIDQLVEAQSELKREVEENLDYLMENVAENTTQKNSMEKYRNRLSNMGILLPKPIREKILHLLGHKK